MDATQAAAGHIYSLIQSALTPTFEAVASGFGVNPAIDHRDFIFWYVIGKPMYQGKPDAGVYRYFETGRQSALNLKDLITIHLERTNVSILDFASGYGCVARHLPVVLPDASIVACDIHDAAVEFLNDTLGIDAIRSTSVPEQFQVNRSFDVVFALSFFSHMPKKGLDPMVGVPRNGDCPWRTDNIHDARRKMFLTRSYAGSR